MDLKGKNVLILGYAMTGKSVANFLLKQGAHITINDRGDLSNDPSVRLFLAQGVKVVDGGHPLSLLDEPIDFIVKNPGIPYHIPIVEKALERNIPIYTDVEIAYWFSKAPFVAITGSNGKTTTTQLLANVLNTKNHQTYLAGNIGIPVLEVVQQATKDDLVVLEMSSFQLAGVDKFKPHVAVLTNIYSAHLDYHHTRQEYVAAKLNLIEHLTENDYLVYNYDSKELTDWVKDTVAQVIPFARLRVDEYIKQQGVYVEDETIYYKDQPILKVKDIQLPGVHNVENILAVVAAAMIYNVPPIKIQQEVQKYQGMPHRNQQIAKSQGRTFYNDSKATNITATITALQSFPTEPILYIGGGLDRGNEFDELFPYLNHVRGAFLYGETKDKMARVMKEAGIPKVKIFDTLVKATTAAYFYTRPGDVVLLSPANASWDQFKTFEERGDLYTKTVQTLIKKHPYQEIGGQEDDATQ